MATGSIRDRPDPEALLARARRVEEASTRGSLRIYFGASAGVGKTYAMLLEGRRLAADGVDVVVGIVETHKRLETAALLDGGATLGAPLETLARRPVGDLVAGEFDLDAMLARKPSLALVDELAHSNPAGSRHPKRWQDIDELLAAGIDVFTTLNVQHLESLNDVVGGITGVRVRETVPDTFFERADEVVLVDVPADELLKRLAAGKIYLPEQAERASRNFFRKGNLMALREIALRRTADRVEEDVQTYRDERAIDPVWNTEAALLCCIGPDAGAEHVVRAAARLAGQLDIGWRAIYVETPRLQRRADPDRERILRVVALAAQLGADTATLSGTDVAEVVARDARQHNISRIVLGRGDVGRRSWFASERLTARIDRLAPELSLVQIGRPGGQTIPEADVEPSTSGRRADTEDDPSKSRRHVRLRFAYAALAIAAVTAIASPLIDALHPTNIAMIYLLAVTVIAMRAGRWPAVAASLLAVAAFDFFFVPPRFSFEVADVQYVVTLATMMTVALVIGTLAANLRYQVRVAAHREERARSLYEIARELSKALRTEDVVGHARETVGALFDADVRILLPAADSTRHGADQRLVIDRTLVNAAGFEPAIAQWAYEHAMAAGTGTDTLPGSAWLFVPLQTPMGARGVIALRPARRRTLMIPEQRRLLETLAALIAIAIERVHYVEVAQGAVLKIESERLRNSILSALSHDLRTPIAALVGLTESLAMSRHDDPAHDASLIAAMQEEAARMGTLVENLLDMARIESGDVRIQRAWNAIEETIGTALAGLRRSLGARHVRTSVPTGLPLVEYDAVLIERVIHNLVENATKYTAPDAAIVIEAWTTTDALHVAVEDDGPGLPPDYDTPERQQSVFDKFTRGVKESPTSGVGLGLAICRAIVEAHGGTIAIDATRHLPPGASRGFRVVVVLPRTAPPSVEDAQPDRVTAEAA